MSFLLNFDRPLVFEPRSFENLDNVVGIYFIFLTARKIAYPFKESRLIYIGMSEKRTNSIASRLANHFEGRSGNFGLQNYRKVDNVKFTYLNFEIIQPMWKQRIEDFESYLLQDFVQRFGVYPICNNKTGFPEFLITGEKPIEINWDYFD
jgi:hypothetical protein